MAAFAALGLQDAESSDEGRAEAAATVAPSIRCYQAATEQTFLEEYRARNLCRGSDTVGPVECYMASRDRTALSEVEGIDLCRCARSTEPVGCYERAEGETDLLEFEIVQMCNARELWGLYMPDCQRLE